MTWRDFVFCIIGGLIVLALQELDGRYVRVRDNDIIFWNGKFRQICDVK